MTASFGFELKGIIKNKEKAEAVISDFENRFGKDMFNNWTDIFETGQDKLCLQIGGNGDMSISMAEELTEWIKKEIAPILVEPCHVAFEHDGDDISFYIGKDKKKLKSFNTLVNIEYEIKDLTKADLLEVVKLCEARLSKYK